MAKPTNDEKDESKNKEADKVEAKAPEAVVRKEKTVRQIWFRHKDGSKKFIPGVKNSEDLEPRMYSDSVLLPGKNGGQKVPVLKLDSAHIVKINLHDETRDIELTATEKKLPDVVQHRILDRRAQEADFMFQANAHIRRCLERYEELGDIEVLEWDKEVPVKSAEASGAIIAELSPIALADFADRGIEVPPHLLPSKKQTTVA